MKNRLGFCFGIYLASVLFPMQSFAEISVYNCEDQLDIRRAINHLVDYWDDFVSFQNAEGYSIPQTLRECLLDRAIDGDIICREDTHLRCWGENGFATPWTDYANICETFEVCVDDCTQSSRSGLYLALSMHEFAHSCGYVLEDEPRNVGEAMISWWWTSHETDSRCDCL